MSDLINYPKLIDQSMYNVVKEALKIISKGSNIGQHCFYISFLTSFPTVKISNKLKNEYPEEITIVLQHQFSNLVVEEEKFSVCLSFHGTQEQITVPFKAISTFTDLSINLIIRFTYYIKEYKNQNNNTSLTNTKQNKDELQSQKKIIISLTLRAFVTDLKMKSKYEDSISS